MPQLIEVPGHGVVEFPDGMSDEQIAAAIKRNLPQQTLGKEAAAVADTSIRGGLSGAIGGLSDLVTSFAPDVGAALAMGPGLNSGQVEALNETRQKLRDSPKTYTPMVQDAILAYTGGPLNQPATPVGKSLGNIGSATVGSMLGPGKFGAKLASGLGAGVGSEAAAKVFGDNIASRMIGGFAGGMAPSMLRAAVPSKGKLAQEVLADVTPSDLQEAQRRMQEARDAGVQLNASQAMPSPSNIDSALATVASSKYGDTTRAQLRAQPGNVEMMSALELSKLPGKIGDPHALATRAQEAATAHIKSLQQAAGKAWQKQAPQGEVLPQQVVDTLDKQLRMLEMKYPNQVSAEMIADVRRGLINPSQPTPGPTILGPNGLPLNAQQPSKYLNNALDLKGAIEDRLSNFGPRNLNTSANDAKLQAAAQEVRKAFKGILDVYAPKLRAANEAYSIVMDQAVKPAKQSVVGQVAGIRGADPTREAAVGKLFGVMDEGTPTGAKVSRILTLEKALRKQDPTIFPDAAKTWFSQRMEKVRSAVSDRAPEDIAAQLTKAFGDPRRATPQWATTQDILAGVARSSGVKESELIDGFRKFMEITSSQSRRPGVIADMSIGDLANPSKGTPLSTVGAVNVMTPLRQPALFAARKFNASVLSAFDKMLTTPEGLAALQKLAKEQPNSPVAQALVQTMLGLGAQQGQQQASQ